MEIKNNSQNTANNPQKEVQKAVKEAQNPHLNEEKEASKQPKEAEKNEKTKETQIKELTTTLQRLQAEFENYQKRNAKQNDEYKTYANARLIEELLPVLDSLEQGMKHDKALAIVHEQLYAILKKNGLSKIHAEKGMKFNHDKMECLMQENDPKLKEDEVVNVLIGGYELNGKILRLTKVSVNAPKTSENENNPQKC